jgi:type II secretory pathway component PulF
VALIAIIVGAFLLRRYLKSPQGRYNIDAFLLKFPILGNFYLKVILSNFSRTLSALLKSGVPILEALSVSQRTISNTVINKVIQDIRLAISEGKTMVEPFIASKIFPSMVIQMVAAGEKTGKLDTMLSEIASFYDRDVEYAIRNISSILEPALLLIMGAIVAFIALAILSPIFNLIKVFRH